MRNAWENEQYASELSRKMPWPGRIAAQLWGAEEPRILQRLERGAFDHWETVYPEGADPRNFPRPLLFASTAEARAALADEFARTKRHGVWRIAGYHTKAEYTQVSY